MYFCIRTMRNRSAGKMGRFLLMQFLAAAINFMWIKLSLWPLISALCFHLHHHQTSLSSFFVQLLLSLKRRTSHLALSMSTWWLGPLLTQLKHVIVNCGPAVCHIGHPSWFSIIPQALGAFIEAATEPLSCLDQCWRAPGWHSQSLCCPGAAVHSV